MCSTLYIDKNALKNNLNFIKTKLSNSTKIIAMVKANAYGCGIIEITKSLENFGVNDFGVALVKEGILLRRAGIQSNILVTSQFLKTDIKNIIKYNLSVCVSDPYMIKLLNKEAAKKDISTKIHIKVDTGMGRLGFKKENILEILNNLKKECKNIILDGIYTHLSCADTDNDYSIHQLEEFDNTVTCLKKSGYDFNYIHALNSYGILKYPNYQFTHVRPGMLLYGYINDVKDISPILTLKSPILRINEINSDTKISYNANYTAKPGQKIATIGLGYADGLPRTCSNKYSVYIGNKRAKIVGNICMDMCMIDVTDINVNLKIGDFVTVFKNKKDIDKISKISKTINYETISRLSNRLDRVFL